MGKEGEELDKELEGVWGVEPLGSLGMEKAIFGAGCFWGVESVFRKVQGVVDVAVGYCGGEGENPNYQEVCSGQTGYAEVVKIEFDPGVLSFEKLLDVFWGSHNPSTLNQQGPDFGTQYRSVIFYLNESQKNLAEASLRNLEELGQYQGSIATEITAAGKFYRAEEYHQRYHEKHGGSCQL
jgi:peptide-methionine (S)-S-oxide reductase